MPKASSCRQAACVLPGLGGSCPVSVRAEGGCAMAADRKSDQGSKEEIAKGMAEAGKGEVGKAGGEAARKGGRGHGADPGKISQGMSEAGWGTGAGTKGLQGGIRRPPARDPAGADRGASRA